MNNTQPDMTLADIIEQSFDFSGVSDEQKEQSIQEASGLIMETAITRALAEGEEPLHIGFNALMETNPDPQQVLDFLRNNVPSFQDLIIEEIQTLLSLSNEENSEV